MSPIQDLQRPDPTPERRREAGADRDVADRAFLWRVARALGVAVAIGLALLLLFFGTEVLLLAFAGVLLAVLLRTPADWLSGRTGLPEGISLALVTLLILAAFAAVGWFTVPRLIEQAGQFTERAAQAIETLDGWLRSLGVNLQRLVPPVETVLGRLPGIVTTTFGVLGSLFVVVVVAIYMAAHPAMYADGLVRLFPVGRRRRVRALLGELGHTLRRWLAGQLLAMAGVGALTFGGLLLLDVPLAFGLGVLAALLEFVPFIGPIAAAVPALLVALTQDPTTALYVALLYLAIQQAEGYLITPLVQQRAVYLPPVLIILAQILMGVLFGLLGIVLATPLAAVALVLVQRVYVEGILGDDTGERDDA
ncbi:MAG TPA: AI-2E family transporter [Geminicoccaceae bacterium]|nr:AI-2E family transporter [Geminicoccaceae bacterium]